MAENGDKTAKAGKGGNIPPPEHQFKPGNPGGPGRPKERPIAAALKVLLEADDKKALKAIAEIAVKKAQAGDYRFVREVWDRTDGKVQDELDVTSAGQPVSSGPDLGRLSPETLAKVNEESGGPEE